MNQVQRNFLIKKIEETVKARIKALEDAKPEAPSLNNYLLHAVMSNNFDIISNEQIKELIRKMALKSKDRDDWMGNSWGSASKNKIFFNATDLFIVPEEYKKLWDEYAKERNRIEAEIGEIHIQADTLITRIQLASDKTLQTMINEVDDMGNISLMDSKLRLLTR